MPGFLTKTAFELTEKPAAAGARDLAVLALKPGGADIAPSPDRGMAAVRIVGSGGKSYAMVAEVPHPPPPPGSEQPSYMIVIRLLAVLTVSGMICYVLARYLTAPILGLGAAARRLASGDLKVRVGPTMGSRNDEISRLAHDFDGMAERIESLLTSQRVLLRDISHELRSPLARLNVAVELCRKRSDAEAGKALDRIEREACKLNELIEQLLTLNRVESGISGHEKTQIDLARLIHEISEDADFEARSMNRSVKFTLPGRMQHRGKRGSSATGDRKRREEFRSLYRKRQYGGHFASPDTRQRQSARRDYHTGPRKRRAGGVHPASLQAFLPRRARPGPGKRRGGSWTGHYGSRRPAPQRHRAGDECRRRRVDH